jgi:hypothetical protein
LCAKSAPALLPNRTICSRPSREAGLKPVKMKIL